MGNRTNLQRITTAMAVAAVASTLTACGGGLLADHHVVSAELSNWSEWSFSVLLGGRAAGADLVIVDDDGSSSSSFSASVAGPGVGVLLDMSVVGDDVIDCGDVNLSVPDGGVPGDALLGGYGGNNVAVGIGIGLTQHQLENDAGVRLNADQFGIVIGLAVGVEYLFLSVGE